MKNYLRGKELTYCIPNGETQCMGFQPFRMQQDAYKYSKICLKMPLKIDKTKVLKTNGSLMKVESIAECSLGAFCNTFDLH